MLGDDETVLWHGTGSCAGTCAQVAKQQEAQRLAAEEARERLRRRGRDSVYDFRFTRFHETGLEQPAALDLGSGIPSLADTAELQARSAITVKQENDRHDSPLLVCHDTCPSNHAWRDASAPPGAPAEDYLMSKL